MFKYLATFTPSYMTGGCNIRKRYFLRIMLINKGYHIFLNVQFLFGL